MARCESYIGLSIDEWAKFMGIDPYEINQCIYGLPTGSTSTQNAQCAKAFMQYEWQQDYLSREEVGRAIAKAEESIAEVCGFWPYPKYFTGEEAQYPQPAERYLFGGGTTKRWQNKSVNVQWKKVLGFGTLVATDLGSAFVGYSSANSINGANGILDTFTVTFNTTITDPTQLALYFTPSDRDNAPFDQTWRIRPILVTISNGVATFTGHRALCVKPELTTAYGANPLDVTVGTNFISQVEVYSLVLDQNDSLTDMAQGVGEWEGIMVNGVFTDCDIPPCTVETWPVCFGTRDWENGIATVDYSIAGQNQPSQAREPDRVVANYYAGVPRLIDGRYDPEWGKIVAHLATAMLTADACACERSRRIIHWWRSFPTDGLSTRVPLTTAQVDDNPFGAQMGALYAWNRMKHYIKLGTTVVL